MSGVLELLLLLGFLGVGGVGAWFGFASKGVDNLVEVRPAGAPDMVTDATIAEELAHVARSIPGVAEVRKVLYISRGDGTRAGPRLVIGMDLPVLPFPTIKKVPPLEGRTLRADDAGENVAMIGKLFAKEHAAAGQDPLALGAMAEVGGTRLQVIGIFSSGIPVMDQQIIIPLDTAQRLFQLQGRVSVMFVVVKRSKDRERVMEALREGLGEIVDVVYPHQHDKHPH